MTVQGQHRIHVCLVDDHLPTREALKEAIQLQSDMTVCSEAGSVADALAALRLCHPDVLILDLILPDGNGWALLEHLRRVRALPPTLVLSVCDESLYARRLLRAGARGYLTKEEPLDTVLEAVRSIHCNRLVASERITSQLVADVVGRDTCQTQPQPRAGAMPVLTDREMLVFGLLATGLTNKEMAAQLSLSEKTVSTHKINLMKKLGVNSPQKLAKCYQTHLRSHPRA